MFHLGLPAGVAVRPFSWRDLLWLLRRRPELRHAPGGLCPRCGYAASGLRHSECPECGADLLRLGVVMASRYGRVKWGAAWVLAGIVGLMALIFLVTPGIHRLIVPLDRSWLEACYEYRLAASADPLIVTLTTRPFRTWAMTKPLCRADAVELVFVARRHEDKPIFRMLTADLVSQTCIPWGYTYFPQPDMLSGPMPIDRDSISNWLTSCELDPSHPGFVDDVEGICALLERAANWPLATLSLDSRASARYPATIAGGYYPRWGFWLTAGLNLLWAAVVGLLMAKLWRWMARVPAFAAPSDESAPAPQFSQQGSRDPG